MSGAEDAVGDQDVPLLTFSGDFFGQDYAPSDFGTEPGMDVDESGDRPENQRESRDPLDCESEDEGESDGDDEAETDLGTRWEPVPPQVLPEADDWEEDAMAAVEEEAGGARAERVVAEDGLRKKPVVEKFTLGSAGRPIQDDAPTNLYSHYMDGPGAGAPETNPWAPFASKLDWEVLNWALT
ncbi:hypothetical protein GLOTRDRAFT_134714 [Gloeophyllum trabeum ATCC 11539]|uniref:Uncharacterized protein n=1 Tax=Gloeophyllum trabeum (strain ATCC 11539 / FP-39264 / Madison 617) TaxID=670483 RepID=S7PQR7_GLOTA|nr:uncharacterized protein GLOTRDRAFT_134714 [Gloeophyllum trabeum ATCC 11539]EPQ49707.1 hypothetical protein GLOTRDRAFT_134714 [Gloeophyllum trabeum ATCC 11539]